MSDASNPMQKAGGLAPDAFSSLFQAIGGLRNLRAMLAMLGCLVLGILLAGALGLMGARGSLLLMFLSAVVLFVSVATGVNASGVLLMDQAKSVPPRSLIDAVVYGVLCIPKLILIALVLLLVSIAVFLAIAIVFLVCKIPVLGPILFTVAFPLSVVICGVTLTGLGLCLFLALPAVWEGATIKHAIAQALAVVRSRLVETLLLMIVVWFLSVFVGVIVFGVLGSGLLPTLGLSAGIIGGGAGGMADMFAGMGAMAMGGGGPRGGGAGAGQMIAGGIGFALLWAVAATLVAQVYLLGLNLVYLRVTEGLDTAATEQALAQGLDEAKRRAAELSQKAKDAAARAREQARQRQAAAAVPLAGGAPLAMATPMASAAPAAGACPSCSATVTPGDVFCGSCGHKLK